MPVVLRVGPYRFFFWSRENDELAQNRGVARHELNELRRLTEQHREQMLEA